MSRRGSSGDVGRGARGRGATGAAGHELGSIRRPPPGRVARNIAAPERRRREPPRGLFCGLHAGPGMRAAWI